MNKGRCVCPPNAYIPDVLANWWDLEMADRLPLGFCFGDRVACIDCPAGVDRIQLEMERYHPYASWIFLFYQRRPAFAELQVLGLLDWPRVTATEGVVDLEVVRTTPQAAIAEQVPGGMCKGEQAPTELESSWPWTWLPFDAPRSADWIGKEHNTTSPLQIGWRIRAYFTGERIPPHFSPPEHMMTLLGAGVVGSRLTRLSWRARFLKEMLHTEEPFLMQQWERIAQEERYVAWTFIQNGLEQYLDQEGLVQDVTPRDLCAFWLRHPNAAPPTFVYSVPLKDVPLSLGLCLPLYAKGRVHLTYRDAPQWWWYQFKESVTRLITNVTQANRKPLDREEPWLQDLVQGAEHYFLKHPHTRIQPPPEPQAPRALALQGPVEFSALYKASPPCIRAIFDAPRFPRNMERLRMLGSFKAVIQDPAPLFAWFEQQNDRYPRDGHSYPTAKARFNYEQTWKSNVGTTYCSNIIRDTRAGTPDCIRCPFVNPNTSQDIEDIKRACGPNETVPFSGPYNLIRRGLKRMQVFL